MYHDGNPNSWDPQNDPFGEEFFLVPAEEETRSRAKQVLQDNLDAVRHHVELVAWELQGNSDLLRTFVSLLWHWKAVEPKWMAEAVFMSVGDVSQMAEAQPLMLFPCLDCGAPLHVRNRLHLIKLHHNLESFCGGSYEDQQLTDLLCKTCNDQREEYEREQCSLDQLRQQALIAEYRKRPYAERRRTREWVVLKRQVHRRDQYRCRLCGRDDLQLHVHHSNYGNYAEERLEDLITLCQICHQHFHSASEVS